MKEELIRQRFIENERNIRDLQDDVERLYKDERYDNFYDEIEDTRKEMITVAGSYEKDLRHLINEMRDRIERLENIVSEYMKT
jgi:archaellum component FlaC